MVNFDKFEKRVKETYGKQEFPFDEQNWEKAAKMIDASRKGKNRGGIFLLSAVALLCTTGLVYYFGFSDSIGSLKKNNLATNDLKTNKELVIKPQTNEETSTENIAGNETNNTIVNSDSETLNNNQVSKNTSSNINTTSINKASVTLNKTSDSDNSKKSADNSASSNSKSKTSDKKASTSSGSNTNENQSNNNSNQTEQTKSNVKNTIPPTLGNNTPNTGITEVKSIPPGGNGNTDKLGNVTNTTSTTPNKQEETVVVSSNSVEAIDILPNESRVTDSSQAIKQMPVDSFKFPPVIKGEGISYATNVKMEHNHKNFLFMEAGATYLLGWNGSGKTDAGGFNLVAGLNFQHYFTNIISAQIGVQYNSIGNLTQTSHTISTVNYDLGIEKDITSIKYQKLHYVVAPIKVAINAGKDNIIGIGCNVAYLLNSESKKEKYKTNSNDPNAVKNNLTSTKETGYVQGFNPIDIQASAFYRRKIYKGLSVNAEFIFGLTDTKNNTFFKSNTFERTTGFKLTLCYDLFKK